jgi:predicted helicase
MVEDFNTQLDRWLRSGRPQEVEGFLRVDEKVNKWIRKTKKVLLRGKHLTFEEASIRQAQYRPYTRRWYFFDRTFSEDVYAFPSFLPAPSTQLVKLVIWLKVGSEWPMFALLSHCIEDHLPQGGSQCFPFYVYDADGSNRRENITDWALKQFRTRYTDKKITKWDVFHYVYGLLHHPGYRARFADNLKKSLPRIPFAPDFRSFAAAGRELAELHLNYEKLEPHPLKFVETPGVPLSFAVTDKMKLSKDRTQLRVNDSLTLAGIPPEVFEYRLGNRSALDWVIDQYQVSEDKRSGIKSSPNRPDDPEYIVRLVGQVVKVSLETARIVRGLPAEYTS